MAIGDLGSKVGADDIEKTRQKLNPPVYKEGFEPAGGNMGDSGFDSSGADEYSFGFDDVSGGSSSGGFDDLFGASPSGGVGGDLFGGDVFGGNQAGGLNDIFGGNSGGVFGGVQEQAPPKKEFSDEAFEYTKGVSKNFLNILVALMKSLKNRTADDWATYSNKLIVYGAGMVAISILGIIIGVASGVKFFSLRGISGKMLVCGGLGVGFGMTLIGTTAAIKLRCEKRGDFSTSPKSLESIPDTSTYAKASDFGGDTDEYDLTDTSGIEDLDTDFLSTLDDLFGESGKSNTDSYDDSDDYEDSSYGEFDEPSQEKDNEINYNALVDNITANAPLVNRKYLFETFKSFFMTNTKEFSKLDEISKDSDEFMYILSLLNNAMAVASRVDDIDIELESVHETRFSYKLKFKRHPKLTDIPRMQTELENFFKSSEKDAEVSATIDTLGNFYIATLLKGNKEIVTLGDCFQLGYVEEYFKNEKNKLPFVLGVDVEGNVLLGDGAHFTAMMVVGQQRSGKSWFVGEVLINMATFNPPELVQFSIIDPKGSMLFKSMALLPHVCFLGEVKDVIPALEDLIEIEAKRRKKLLADNRCETVWGLRKKGINIPFIYLVLDEIITIISELSKVALEKEFSLLLLTATTQLPSLGIGVLIVPHRAQGMISPPMRAMIQLTAAVKAPESMVKEVLDVTKWRKPLVNPGDIAMNCSYFTEGPRFVRGVGMTLSDEDNIILIENIAKTFYKMGVELPDMTSLGRGYNRDEKYIKQELRITTGNKTQFNVDDLDDITDDGEDYGEY